MQGTSGLEQYDYPVVKTKQKRQCSRMLLEREAWFLEQTLAEVGVGSWIQLLEVAGSKRAFYLAALEISLEMVWHGDHWPLPSFA